MVDGSFGALEMGLTEASQLRRQVRKRRERPSEGSKEAAAPRGGWLLGCVAWDWGLGGPDECSCGRDREESRADEGQGFGLQWGQTTSPA